jgi:molecular chaperone DnaJ
VPTLDGKIKFSIPEGTQTGKEFSMAGRGIPQVGNPKRRGMHRFFVVVETPTKLNKEQRELLEKLEASLEGKSGPKRKKFFDTLKDFFD